VKTKCEVHAVLTKNNQVVSEVIASSVMFYSRLRADWHVLQTKLLKPCCMFCLKSVSAYLACGAVCSH